MIILPSTGSNTVYKIVTAKVLSLVLTPEMKGAILYSVFSVNLHVGT